MREGVLELIKTCNLSIRSKLGQLIAHLAYHKRSAIISLEFTLQLIVSLKL
jgi:hypothetical protein